MNARIAQIETALLMADLPALREHLTVMLEDARNEADGELEAQLAVEQAMDDHEVVARIAALLGSARSYRNVNIDDIADLIGLSGRIHPGNADGRVIDYYRRRADALGITYTD